MKEVLLWIGTNAFWIAAICFFVAVLWHQVEFKIEIKRPPANVDPRLMLHVKLENVQGVHLPVIKLPIMGQDHAQTLLNSFIFTRVQWAQVVDPLDNAVVAQMGSNGTLCTP